MKKGDFVKWLGIGLILFITVLAGCTGSSNSNNNPIAQNPLLGTGLQEELYEQKCSELNSSQQIARLGFVEARDDVDQKTVGFVVCHRKNLDTLEEDVIIQSNIAVGAGLTLSEARKKAQQALAESKPFVTFGLPFNPLGPGDKRMVEYRLYQQNGEPTAIEVFVVMRNADRSPKEAKTLRVDWPIIG